MCGGGRGATYLHLRARLAAALHALCTCECGCARAYKMTIVSALVACVQVHTKIVMCVCLFCDLLLLIIVGLQGFVVGPSGSCCVTQLGLLAPPISSVLPPSPLGAQAPPARSLIYKTGIHNTYRLGGDWRFFLVP